MESLIKHNDFSKEEALEVIKIIKIEEELTRRQAKYYNFSQAYDSMGAKWDRDEILKYMNQDKENQLNIYEILRFDFVYQLESGLIITWDY